MNVSDRDVFARLMSLSVSLQQRRKQLAKLISFPVILWSGKAPSRNFPANQYQFRASSHFLYFAGVQLENTTIRLAQGELELFMDNPPESATLWHGEMPTREEIAIKIGADRAYPLSKLSSFTEEAATIPAVDTQTYHQQCDFLDRKVQLTGKDLELAKAIVELRMCQDEAALEELKQAAKVSVQAHRQGIQSTKQATTEAEVRSHMERVILAHNMSCAYNSIVSVQGEVLHNEHYHNSLQPGDLLLADVGAETASGWASDITRTWAVSGKFSSTQRDVYEVVLAAHDACIAAMRPGVEYRDVHLLAGKVIAEGLVNLGILKGNPEDLVAQDAHALFFPHGVGHLLGLDVHDMEDLGDVAGYKPGRTRSDRFGLQYLRLDRPLKAGMLVTIEPGFYQVPAILNNAETRARYQKAINWERLAEFADVRGIRIEDDVLVTHGGTEVLTKDLPTAISEIESLVCEGVN